MNHGKMTMERFIPNHSADVKNMNTHYETCCFIHTPTLHADLGDKQS